MDVFSTLDGQPFVWNSDKAASNVSAHGVGFEQAREAFLDPLARYGTPARTKRRDRLASA
jgi:uncharacterized DUF497 family protein